MTIASVIGMLWMARKWRQHWLCWIIANAAGFIALYGAEDYISSFVYVVNFGTAFFRLPQVGAADEAARQAHRLT